LGEDTFAVMRECGFDEQSIQKAAQGRFVFDAGQEKN
jgi:hypothetical protein